MKQANLFHDSHTYLLHLLNYLSLRYCELLVIDDISYTTWKKLSSLFCIWVGPHFGLLYFLLISLSTCLRYLGWLACWVDLVRLAGLHGLVSLVVVWVWLNPNGYVFVSWPLNMLKIVVIDIML